VSGVPCAPGASALYRAEDVRALDRAAIEGGIPGIELMERAGTAAWARFATRWPGCRRLAVLCGPGNNGGDGFVVARLARAEGVDAQVYLLGDPQRLRGDAATALARLTDTGAAPRPLAEFDPRHAGAVADALFGTGLARAIEGEAARAVAAANAGGGPRLALDVPSGLSADTGNALGPVLRADLTVTFIGLKRGLFTGDAREHCGEVALATLDVPPAVHAAVPPAGWRVAPGDLGRPLGPRPRRAHKGHFGHVLIIGGDTGFAGAARLAAEAAARTGAGLTSVATRAAHVAALLAARPELMVRAVDEVAHLGPLLGTASVLAVGPGLGRGEWGRALLARALRTPLPRVLDADALNLLAGDDALRALAAQAPCVITPHPGEAGRLLGAGAAEVERDRFAAAEALADRLGGVVLLKGAGTLVQAPGEVPRVVEGGNPGMASGGMGDVLTGIVAALMAQGMPALEAATAGAALHAGAGDAAARAGGERGLLAGDLLARLRPLVARL